MQHKGTKHGTGSGRRAIQYLLAEMDSKGNIRAGVDVLRGDPWGVADLIDSLPFKYKYTSSILGFAVEEDPQTEEIESLLIDLEKVYFAGLSPNRYCWCVVMHTGDDGRKDIHIVVARVDLDTGKSFNPLPPGHIGSLDHLRDYYNHKHGWARPDDPVRRNMIEKGLDAHNPGDRTSIENALWSLVESGKIKSRDDVITQLKEWGSINRQGKTYVTVIPEGKKQGIKLRGGMFESNWTAEGELKRKEAHAQLRKTGRGGVIDLVQAEAAFLNLEKAVRSRSSYNQSYYKKPSKVVISTVDEQNTKTNFVWSGSLTRYRWPCVHRVDHIQQRGWPLDLWRSLYDRNRENAELSARAAAEAEICRNSRVTELARTTADSIRTATVTERSRCSTTENLTKLAGESEFRESESSRSVSRLTAIARTAAATIESVGAVTIDQISRVEQVSKQCRETIQPVNQTTDRIREFAERCGGFIRSLCEYVERRFSRVATGNTGSPAFEAAGGSSIQQSNAWSSSIAEFGGWAKREALTINQVELKPVLEVDPLDIALTKALEKAIEQDNQRREVNIDFSGIEEGSDELDLDDDPLAAPSATKYKPRDLG